MEAGSSGAIVALGPTKTPLLALGPTQIRLQALVVLAQQQRLAALVLMLACLERRTTPILAAVYSEMLPHQIQEVSFLPLLEVLIKLASAGRSTLYHQA